MGYQVVFTLTTALVAALLAVVARGGSDPAHSGLWAGLLLLGVMTGGGVGLLFVPPVGAWVAYQLVRAARGGAGVARCGLVLLPLAAAVAYFGWTAWDAAYSAPLAERYGFGPTLRHAAEFLSEGIGPIGQYDWPSAAAPVLIVEVATALGLLAVAARRPAERPVALGWMAVLASIGLVALAVGYARPSGFASRYACVACLGPCVSLLAAARYVRLPRPVGLPLTFALLIFAAPPLCRGNWRIAQEHAWFYRVRYEALAADIRAGVPVEFAADRHVLFPVPACRDGFRLLHAHGFGPLRGIPDTPPLESEVVPLPAGTRIPAWDPATELSPPRLALPIDAGKPMAAVRLRFRCGDSRYWQEFRLKWVSADDGAVRTSTIYPWLVPGESTTSFWVDGRVRSAWVEPGCATAGLEILAVEVFRPSLR